MIVENSQQMQHYWLSFLNAYLDLNWNVRCRYNYNRKIRFNNRIMKIKVRCALKKIASTNPCEIIKTFVVIEIRLSCMYSFYYRRIDVFFFYSFFNNKLEKGRRKKYFVFFLPGKCEYNKEKKKHLFVFIFDFIYLNIIDYWSTSEMRM